MPKLQTYVTEAELQILAGASHEADSPLPWLRTLQLSRLRLASSDSRSLLPDDRQESSPILRPALVPFRKVHSLNFYITEGSTGQDARTLFPEVSSALCRDWPAVTDPGLLQVDCMQCMCMGLVTWGHMFDCMGLVA